MTDSQREAWTAFATVAMLSVGIELFHRALLACILPSNDSDLAAALKQALQSLRPWGEALLAKRALHCNEALYKLQVAAQSRELHKCTSLVDFQSL